MLKIKISIFALLLPCFIFAEVMEVNISQNQVPILKRKEENSILQIKIKTSEFDIFNSVSLSLEGSSDVNDIEKIQLFCSWRDSTYKRRTNLITETSKISSTIDLKRNMTLLKGDTYFWISCKLKENANIKNTLVIKVKNISVNSKNVENGLISQKVESLKMGIALRKHNDDGVDSYRIPGLATSNKGTLLAVYDVRYRSAADLQENIDVGLNRSTDGGNTWEPMKIIMDMKEADGLPNDQNGIGDPSILVDKITGTIWVAAIWQQAIPYQRNWWGSKQGNDMKTSQFMLVKSEDDGLTWSEPINITEQIKNPNWFLLLQGPGKGITLKDGTLVFPAQFKDEKQVPYSTIICSKDRGLTWTIGTGVKKQTTEAQVVELDDGSIMINCRNNFARGKKGVGRIISITKDFGKTWVSHSTSEVALEEPTCMAGLEKNMFGKYGELILFSNPNSYSRRDHMTIKYSDDDGLTWKNNNLLIDQLGGRGYSSITKVNDNTIGILYEGSGADLIFQLIGISDIINKNN